MLSPYVNKHLPIDILNTDYNFPKNNDIEWEMLWLKKGFTHRLSIRLLWVVIFLKTFVLYNMVNAMFDDLDAILIKTNVFIQNQSL